MLDGSLALQVSAATTLRTVKASLPRGSDMLSGALPNYKLYATADGKHVAFGALELKFFHKFLQAVERPDLMKLAPVPGPGGQPLHAALRSEEHTSELQS